MHIIGGKLKGRKLAKCKTSSIRPAMALVRKSIFDTLGDFIQASNVLDLCAGSGVLGIEALSRGARNLTLIDLDKNAINLIYKNLKLCNINAKVIRGKLPKALNKKEITSQKFNLIFLDPPYGESSFIEENLNAIILNNILEKNGLISIESEVKSKFLIPDGLELLKEKKYGNTKVTILKRTVSST